MSLTIHPDPQEPAGGFAFLELPGGTLGEGPVNVAVMEVYGSRWLGPTGEADDKVTIGEAHWQGERHDFGPYPVHQHDGADWVRIGPEIVNKIDEYTSLRISVGGQVGDVTWPDDVPPRAGAAVLGGLQPTARTTPQDDGAALVGKPTDPAPAPDPVPKPPETPEAGEPESQRAPKMRALWQPLILVLLMCAVSAALWAMITRDDSPVVTEDTCTLPALMALDGFVATQKAIRACGDALSPDTVLKIVEGNAAQDDPDALLLFGTLYDGSERDEKIEGVIGLTFDHDAVSATEYYARAAQAGSDEARIRLGVTCAQLAGSDETLAKGAYDDFCR